MMNRLRCKDLEARFPGVLKGILAAAPQEDRAIQRRGERSLNCVSAFSSMQELPGPGLALGRKVAGRWCGS
jgi:hypothetical protein